MDRRSALAVMASGLALPAFAAKRRLSPATAGLAIDRNRIDATLRQMVSANRAAGASCLIWQRGAERYFGAFGFADREAKRAMARDTLVQIFSMTKPVTGVALMQLWEQGKFGLDDPLANYLPAFGKVKVLAGGTGADSKPLLRDPARPIIVRDIMRHTAGFSYGMRDTAADKIFHEVDPLALTNTLDEFGDKLASVPLLFDPGAEWSYSAAVDVQALLVERLTGEKFEPYVRRTILEPLGMKDTAWTQPPERLARFAATYTQAAGGKLDRVPDDKARALNFGPRKLTMGGAGLASTLDDYMRFARMLLGRGTLDGTRILSPDTIRVMSTDQLDPRITKRFFLPGKGSVGFGIDFAVRIAPPKDAKENRGAVGEFFWDGAETTLFWVDPLNDLAAVFFVQVLPFDGTLHHDIRQAVYGPGYTGPAA
ncbi:serine hydrolase domain-containing protein [Sphingomonas mali]|uniref:serine hydrolase domain-containing protein n=1 Tax=Sphingomonas mali TaxID=40682 RepID=UPI00082A0C99|nr:serine hydrolase domain-containing protein [Sphingomonas mali]